jgi:hypothetical protein
MAIYQYSSRVSEGIVGSNLLDEFAVARCARVSNYDEIKWTLLASVTLESDFNSHKK